MSVRSVTQSIAGGLGLGASALLLFDDQQNSKLKTAAAVTSLLANGYLFMSSNPGNVRTRIERALPKLEDESSCQSLSGEQSDPGRSEDSPATPPSSSSHVGPLIAAGLGCASAFSLLPGAAPSIMALSTIAGTSPLITAATKVMGDRQIDETYAQIYQRIIDLRSKSRANLGHVQAGVEKKLSKMTPAESLEALAEQYKLFKEICTIQRAQTPARSRGSSEGVPVTTSRTLTYS